MFTRAAESLRTCGDLSHNQEKKYFLLAIEGYVQEIWTAEEAAKQHNPAGLLLEAIKTKLKAFYHRKQKQNTRAKIRKGEILLTGEKKNFHSGSTGGFCSRDKSRRDHRGRKRQEYSKSFKASYMFVAE